jgi:two-component system cell cycle sensor histidine kinase/response regulator CckA
VLVVEDEALVAEEIHDRLERLKVDVVGIADTGEEALRVMEEHLPNLVLMDIRLKGPMDGIQAATQIRERYDVPVVYLTAHSDPSTLERAMQGASFGYILKPFQEKDLQLAIASAVSRAKAEQVLKDRNATYAAMLASIADAVVAVDNFGHLNFLNSAAETLTGWARDDIMGRPAEDVLRLVDAVTRDAVELPAVRALRHGVPERATRELLLIDREGRAIPVTSSAAPVFDSRGRTSSAVMVMQDLRDRRDRVSPPGGP